MKKRRVVVTGLGVVSSIGIGRDEFWKANIAGESGVDRILNFDASKLSSQIASIVKNFKPEDFIPKDVVKSTDRFVHFALASSKQALSESNLDLDKEDTEWLAGVVK